MVCGFPNSSGRVYVTAKFTELKALGFDLSKPIIVDKHKNLSSLLEDAPGLLAKLWFKNRSDICTDYISGQEIKNDRIKTANLELFTVIKDPELNSEGWIEIVKNGALQLHQTHHKHNCLSFLCKNNCPTLETEQPSIIAPEETQSAIEKQDSEIIEDVSLKNESVNEPNGLNWLLELFPDDDKINVIHQEMRTHRGNKGLSTTTSVWLQSNLSTVAKHAMSDDERGKHYDVSLNGDRAFLNKNLAYKATLKKTGWDFTIRTFTKYLSQNK